MTGRDMVRRTLMLLGVLAEGENPSASQLQDGISALNEMLDSWSIEGLAVPNDVREEFTLTPGTASYTMGSSGTFNTTRPFEIKEAKIEVQQTDAYELPVRVIDIKEWAAIALKDTQSEFPEMLYPQMGHPLITLNLYPVPSAANKLVLYTTKPLSAITANTTISLPPGYEKAIRFNFAIDQAPEYGKVLGQDIYTQAAQSKGNIKRRNIKPIYAQCDALPTGMRGAYNILTGE